MFLGLGGIDSGGLVLDLLMYLGLKGPSAARPNDTLSFYGSLKPRVFLGLTPKRPRMRYVRLLRKNPNCSCGCVPRTWVLGPLGWCRLELSSWWCRGGEGGQSRDSYTDRWLQVMYDM